MICLTRQGDQVDNATVLDTSKTGRENPFCIGAPRHPSRTGAFFTPSVRLFNGGLGEASASLAGLQYAGFSPSSSLPPSCREKLKRRLQSSVLESKP